MANLWVIALILILVGAAMYFTGFDVPLPKIGSAGIAIAIVGVIVLIVWLIFTLIASAPRG